MKANNQQCISKQFKRIVAGIVALSMLLIPVHFPGTALAAEENAANVVSNYFADNFQDNSNIDGLTYQWKTNWTNSKGQTTDWTKKLYVDDGKLMFHTTDDAGAYVYYAKAVLTATTTDPGSGSVTDTTMNWKDYTVEADITRLSATNTHVGLMGRVTCDENGQLCHYTYAVRDGDAFLYKNYIDDTGAYKNNVMLKRVYTVKAGQNMTNHLKMEFSGTMVRCYFNDTLVIEYNDVDASMGAPLNCGSVGIYVCGKDHVVSCDTVRFFLNCLFNQYLKVKKAE